MPGTLHMGSRNAQAQPRPQRAERPSKGNSHGIHGFKQVPPSPASFLSTLGGEVVPCGWVQLVWASVILPRQLRGTSESNRAVTCTGPETQAAVAKPCNVGCEPKASPESPDRPLLSSDQGPGQRHLQLRSSQCLLPMGVSRVSGLPSFSPSCHLHAMLPVKQSEWSLACGARWRGCHWGSC